ncbi:Uma2 family endonuclease, partial [Sphingomonas sp.]|uniref:Uma2 family endonuclease n=1 Tax=Sphingomonas sp. TaxID=28214 RepID=UPI00334027F5
MSGRLYAKLLTAYSRTEKRLAVDLMVGIDAWTVRGADVAVVLPDVPPTGPVPPDRFVLIVEIAVTTLSTDLGEKLAEYARAGIPEYWVVDVPAKVTHRMLAPEGDLYAERTVVPFDQPLAVPATSETIVVA